MKKLLFLMSIAAALGVHAASVSVDSVNIRQQWPWSTDVKVSYMIVNSDGPVDLTVKAYTGYDEVPINPAGLKGEVYGVDGDGEHVFYIDVRKAFGADRQGIPGFNVSVDVKASAAGLDEVLYKIFDLDSGSCTDVTRADILNGKYGSYETDYSKVGNGFSTPLDDVLVWTGVNENIAYKTTKLVMRRINAKDKVWKSGDPAGAAVGNAPAVPQKWVKLTYDYYIAVFETTLAQWQRLGRAVPTGDSSWPFARPADDPYETGPVNDIYYADVVGSPNGSVATYGGLVTGEAVSFPTNSYLRDVGRTSVSAVLWQRTGYEFTLPTMAEWEFACMGGNTTVLYSGKEQITGFIHELAWTSENSGGIVHKPGEKAPNAYGLYDMLGNVLERVLGVGDLTTDATAAGSEADPLVNPLGKKATRYRIPHTSTDNPRYMGGGGWNPTLHGSKYDCRHAAKCPNYSEWDTYRNMIGFRLVCPATENHKWAPH